MPLVSVVIPCRNEQDNITDTVLGIQKEFEQNSVDYEVIIVNDGSTDNTENIVKGLSRANRRIRLIKNDPPYGIGNAIKRGLNEYKGEFVITAMADASDDPKDMVSYVREVQKGYDCCFGSRWQKGALVENYPRFKLLINRLANFVISVIFGLRYNDVTNAFKCYSRETIEGIKPILSHHFNVTIELPLKAIIRGYHYAVVVTNWRGRKRGFSSLAIKEMGSRYLFIMLYLWLEKTLSKGDYRRKSEQ